VSESFEFQSVDRVAVGAVGEPGRRVFYLQARAGRQLVTFKCEKQQIAALAEYLDGRLADLPDPEPVFDDLELEEPLDAVWAVGPIGVAYDADRDIILIEAQERLTEDSEDEAAVARLALTRHQAAALAAAGAHLVTAGRPLCEHCGHPLDPSGHICPRTNGHRPPPP
jgi:uncharacterized repeat protein (TIGR03847 family)